MPTSTELDGFEQTAYRPILRLNRGAAADVLLAEHRGLEKLVVLKVLRAEAARDPWLVDRLRFEAQTLSRLASPNLVLVTDIGRTPDGRSYFVMDHFLGHTLDKELAARGALGVADAISVARQTLEGLSVVHAAGIAHRRIRPEHLFLAHRNAAPMAVKILGFGMAKAVGADEAALAPRPVAFMTRKSEPVGSSSYMAPEHLFGAPMDVGADLYAVGCLLFEALTGAPPFADQERTDPLRADTDREPRAPSMVGAPCSTALDAAVLRALAKDPGARFSTARAFSDALAQLAAEVSDHGRGASQRNLAGSGASMANDADARLFRLGDTFERFEITELLGVGFMGEVYEVAHRHQDRRYAIKFLRLAHRADVDKVERSLAEAEVMLRMDHANIVRVHDAGVTPDGTVWMRMDRLYGKTLRELIGRARLSAITALHLAEEIAWGLDHAHELSVIHRDVKPENVFVTTEPRVVLLDLGLAKFIPHELEKTGPLRLLGTMAYAAPERLVGATLVDGRVDIYSLGVVLFEMLAGAHPFVDVLEDAEALGHAHLTREPQGLAELGLPEYVLSLVRKLMAKDPDGRHFTASDSAKALRAARQRLVDDAQEGRYFDEGLRLEVVASPTRRGYVAPVPPPVGPMAPVTVAPNVPRVQWRLVGVVGALLVGVVMIGWTWLRGLPRPAAIPAPATSDVPPSLEAPSTASFTSSAPIAPLPSARVEPTTSAPVTTSRSTSTAPAPRPRPRAPLPPVPSTRPKLPF